MTNQEKALIELRDGLLSIYHGLQMADCDHVPICKAIKNIAKKRLVNAGVMKDDD